MNDSAANLAPLQITLYDRWLLFSIICLITIGLLMVASASIVIAERGHQDPFYYLFRQIIFLSFGLVGSLCVLRLNTKTLLQLSPYALLLSYCLLILVFIPGIGRTVNGSTRWIDLILMRFQVSEMVKLCVVIYISGYVIRHEETIKTLQGFAKPIGLLCGISGLLLCQPDFGATAVIMATTLGILFLAGVRLWQFITLFATAVAGFAILAISAPYRLLRLTSFLNPWAQPFDSGYQLTQSLIAFGRGGWRGVGLGESVQKLFYLPEAHTDFLFAVLAEELGFITVIAVMILFMILIGRGCMIARRAFQHGNAFSGYLAYGLSLWLSLQVLINIGVNVGMLPTKGLTLPLMSYGGSSIVVNCLLLGLLLRIDHETRLEHYCLEARSWW